MAPIYTNYLKDLSLIFLSSILLILSFPDFNLGFLAWVGLLPLLIAMHEKNAGLNFLLSFICGLTFLVGIFYWIFEISKYTILHEVLLGLYVGTFSGFFGMTFSFISRRWGTTPALFAAPFIWVSLEYARSNLDFLSLPWALLAHSQYQYSAIIQIVSITGTYGLSFLIVMVNAALAAVICPYLAKFSGQKIPPNLPGEISTPTLPPQRGREFSLDKGIKILVAGAALFFVLTFTYGQLTIAKPIIGNRVKVSLVQANIEQSKKWDRRYGREIMQIYSELTKEVSADRPALIIWPETATPGAIDMNASLYMELVSILRNAGTYLLLGSAQYQKFQGKGLSLNAKLANSAYLFHSDPAKAKIQRYDKIRLFPFGEYLPYRGIIPWSAINVSSSGEYMGGKEFTIFKHSDFSFGVTICWENVFPELFRQFVKRGAQCMINITNEARFGKTAAPHQLAAISVFRAVENGVFVVRCANTGVSCIIDPYGRIVDRVKDEKGQDIFVRGIMTGWIIPIDSKTIYTQYGDLMVCVAILGTLVILGVSVWKGRVK